MSTKRTKKPAPQPAADPAQQLVALPPVRADVFQAAAMLIDAGRKAVPMNSQAQTAVLAVTQWLESAQQDAPPPPAPPAEPPKGPAAAHDAPVPAAAAAPVALNRAARHAVARKGK